jgi:hypothetical protein
LRRFVVKDTKNQLVDLQVDSHIVTKQKLIAVLIRTFIIYAAPQVVSFNERFNSLKKQASEINTPNELN